MALGDFIWFELVTHDSQQVEDFYKKIIGWTPRTQSSTGGSQYTLFYAGETPVAGISPASPPPEAQSHWFGYLHAEQLEQSAERVETLGGTVHEGPMKVAGLGEFYIVSDPSGVVFALFDPDAPSDFDAHPPEAPGFFDWKELYAENLDESFKFYSELLGWERGPVHEMEHGRYQLLRNDGEEIAGITGLDEMEGEELPEPHWNFYVRVRDVEQSSVAIQGNEGHLLSGPMEVPGGDRVVIFQDPGGAVASLTSSPD